MLFILITLIILLILTLKKVSTLVAALIAILPLLLFSGLPILSTISKDYMSGVAGFIQNTWLMILLGALFAKIMDVTGTARAIAHLIIKTMGVKNALISVVVTGILLTYGGISSMVAVFAIYPIALSLFRQANLPRYLIPAAIGAGVFAYDMLPGTPSTLNIIPTTFLGTTAMAAPALGIVAAVTTFVLTFLYFRYEAAKAKKNGLGFVADKDIEKLLARSDELEKQGALPNPWLSLIPSISIVISLNALKWNILAALLCGIIVCTLLFFKKINFKEITGEITNAASGAALAVFSAATIVGMGSVIKITPGFQQIVDTVLSFSDSGINPLVIFGAATSILCGLNASGVGGLSITLSALTEPFINMGVNPEVLHRIGVIAALGLDSLPHSGGIVALLTVTGISYKDGYKHLFMTTVVISTIALVVAIICAIAFYK